MGASISFTTLNCTSPHPRDSCPRVTRYTRTVVATSPQRPQAALPTLALASCRCRCTRMPPPPPPATAAAYKKKSGESNSVIAMMDLLVKDLDEETIAEAADKRRQDSKSLTDKEAGKADLESALEKSGADKKSATTDLMGTEKYIASLHSECDWLVKYYEVRKEARNDEIESLGKAKAVLSGADYSLLQRSHARKFLRRA